MHVTLQKKSLRFFDGEKAAWLSDCAHCIDTENRTKKQLRTATLLSTLIQTLINFFLCWRTTSCGLLFFSKDTHTSACKLFHAALPLETSEETEHSPREYDKQRRETKKKKELQGYGDNMCHSVYPQYVRVWRGTTFQYRGKGRDSKELVVIQRKKFFLAHRYSSGRTWRGSVASETDADFFFIYLERKNEEEAMWCFYSFPREPQLSSTHEKK